MEKREIIFSKKLLWAGLAGLLPGAYYLGAGYGWRLALASTVMYGIGAVLIIRWVLDYVANYMADRKLEGQSVFQASIPILITVVAMTLVVVFRDEILPVYRSLMR